MIGRRSSRQDRGDRLTGAGISTPALVVAVVSVADIVHPSLLFKTRTYCSLIPLSNARAKRTAVQREIPFRHAAAIRNAALNATLKPPRETGHDLWVRGRGSRPVPLKILRHAEFGKRKISRGCELETAVIALTAIPVLFPKHARFRVHDEDDFKQQVLGSWEILIAMLLRVFDKSLDFCKGLRI